MDMMEAISRAASSVGTTRPFGSRDAFAKRVGKQRIFPTGLGSALEKAVRQGYLRVSAEGTRCPAVPSPSIDPRKGDDLITNYQDLLIERGQIPRNVLRVSEQDPFEAYQELVTTIKEYGETYELLDGCKVLLSAHSSKLLSVACLLAAYDAHERHLCYGVSVAFVEALGHRYDPAEGTHADPSELFELWLAGDPYIP